MTDTQALVDLGNEIANAVDDTLREVLGETHGFVLMICAAAPGTGEGPGHIFSNIEPSCIREILASGLGAVAEDKQARH